MNKYNVNIIIMAREGSKGVPRKNCQYIAGHSPLELTFDHLVCHEDGIGLDSYICVSTDSVEVADVANQKGLPALWRPSRLCGDSVSAQEVVAHAYHSCPVWYDKIVVLGANMPFRPTNIISRCLDRLAESEADSVQSVREVGACHPDWMLSRNDADGTLRPLEWGCGSLYGPARQRQNLPPVYVLTGSALVVRAGQLGNADYRGRDREYVIEDGYSLEIDTHDDLMVAEALLRGDQQ